MTATIASIALAQNKYRNVIEKAIEVAPTSYNLVKTEEWEGTRIEWAHKTALLPSVGFTNEGANFRVAQEPTLLRPFVGRKFLDGSAQMTNQAMRAARGGGNSFKALSEFMMESVTEAYIQLRNVAFAGDGSGVVGYILGSEATAAALTESSASVTAGHTFIRVGWQLADGSALPSGRNPINPVRGLWENGVYDVINENGSDAVLGPVTIKARIGYGSARASAYYELGTGGLPASIAVGDPLVKSGGLGLAYDGLASLIDDDVTGTFQGIDYTSNPTASNLVSTVLSNGGTRRAMSQELANRAFQGISERTNGSDAMPDGLKCVGHPAMMHEMSRIYAGEIRIAPSDKVAGTSVSGLATPFGEMVLRPDAFFAPGSLYLVDPSKLSFVVQDPMHFLPAVQGQSGTWVQSRTAAVLEAKILETAQMCIFERRTSARIDDLIANIQTGL